MRNTEVYLLFFLLLISSWANMVEAVTLSQAVNTPIISLMYLLNNCLVP